MLLICTALLIIILVFDLPSLQEPPAFCTMGMLIILYCPVSILFATCVSYIFDKTDSAQSILPNIVTFLGLIPFLLVMVLDMLRIGRFQMLKWCQLLHFINYCLLWHYFINFDWIDLFIHDTNQCIFGIYKYINEISKYTKKYYNMAQYNYFKHFDENPHNKYYCANILLYYTFKSTTVITIYEYCIVIWIGL